MLLFPSPRKRSQAYRQIEVRNIARAASVYNVIQPDRETGNQMQHGEVRLIHTIELSET